MKTLFKKYHFAYLLLAAALLLSACVPTAAQGTTLNATEAAELVETAVAQALREQTSQMTAQAPQATPTSAATNTPIPAPPTLTPVPTITPVVIAASPTTAAAAGGSGGGTVTLPEYACELMKIEPNSWTGVYYKGQEFDINITIKNTGTATWSAGTDIVFSSGTDLTKAGDGFAELANDLKPGETFNIGPFDGIAPDKNGTYVMTFKVQGISYCNPYASIYVNK